jgi:D-threonate/D-erythronate kinase
MASAEAIGTIPTSLRGGRRGLGGKRDGLDSTKECRLQARKTQFIWGLQRRRASRFDERVTSKTPALEWDKRVFILADDLTGSADAANYFRCKRRLVRVTFMGDAPWDLTLGPHVVQVFDTESRALPSPQARRRIEQAASPLVGRSNPLRIFKKVDSTLRGNLGIELEATLRTLGRHLAVLAPAFPANRRIVREGRLFVDGIPVTQTSFGADPRNPVRADRVADVVRETSDLAVCEIGLDAVRAGPSRVAEVLGGLSAHPSIAVCDAETQDDLGTIAAAIGVSCTLLPCGSAGLSHAIARIWIDDTGTARPDEADRSIVPPPQRPHCSHVLIAVGSANAVAREQLAVLRRAIGLPVVAIRPRLLTAAASRESEVTRAREEAVRSPGRILAVAISTERIKEGAARMPHFQAYLAQVGLAWLESRPPGQVEAVGLVCTGGDTTLALCRAIGIRAIWPEGEISPGVPWSRIEGTRRTMLLVSKAGGFGAPTALLDAVRFLSEE